MFFLKYICKYLHLIWQYNLVLYLSVHFMQVLDLILI